MLGRSRTLLLETLKGGQSSIRYFPMVKTPPVAFPFDPPKVPTVKIHNPTGDAEMAFPVHRIFCVGRNYADHIREMGGDPKRSKPVFFTKPSSAVVPTKSEISYPLATSNLHYEVELVIAIGKEGVQIPVSLAQSYVYGYAVGIDLTRRDLQSMAKDKGLPWDAAKALDQGAPISSITPTSTLPIQDANISLSVNGKEQQSGNLNQMIWSVPEIISELSQLFHLQAGDLIFTGTPHGVGPIVAGDHIKGMVDGLEDIEFTLI